MDRLGKVTFEFVDFFDFLFVEFIEFVQLPWEPNLVTILLESLPNGRLRYIWPMHAFLSRVTNW